jgi:3-hydroxyisobutyrate dehydrogenase-like beta-hydroxyacid dehydrogenase
MMHKDIRLALATAREQGVPLPSASTVEQVLTRAAALGYEHRDIARLFDVLAAGPKGTSADDEGEAESAAD